MIVLNKLLNWLLNAACSVSLPSNPSKSSAFSCIHFPLALISLGFLIRKTQRHPKQQSSTAFYTQSSRCCANPGQEQTFPKVCYVRSTAKSGEESLRTGKFKQQQQPELCFLWRKNELVPRINHSSIVKYHPSCTGTAGILMLVNVVTCLLLIRQH